MDDRSPFLWNLVGVQAARLDIQHHNARMRSSWRSISQKKVRHSSSITSFRMFPCQARIKSFPGSMSVNGSDAKRLDTRCFKKTNFLSPAFWCEGLSTLRQKTVKFTIATWFFLWKKKTANFLRQEMWFCFPRKPSLLCIISEKILVTEARPAPQRKDEQLYNWVYKHSTRKMFPSSAFGIRWIAATSHDIIEQKLNLIYCRIGQTRKLNSLRHHKDSEDLASYTAKFCKCKKRLFHQIPSKIWSSARLFWSWSNVTLVLHTIPRKTLILIFLFGWICLWSCTRSATTPCSICLVCSFLSADRHWITMACCLPGSMTKTAQPSWEMPLSWTGEMAWTVTQGCSSNKHWAEVTLCQHHRRHSRRGITKNVHCLSVVILRTCSQHRFHDTATCLRWLKGA